MLGMIEKEDLAGLGLSISLEMRGKNFPKNIHTLI